MDPLVIEAEGDKTPAVTLDKAKGVFEISGWSYPEDAINFYAPVFSWMDRYAESPNAETTFNFHFQYYNTSSAKQIFRLISLLEEVGKKSRTKVKWIYDNDDTDMLSSGEKLSKMSTVPFEFLPR